MSANQLIAVARVDGSVSIVSFATQGRGNVLPAGAEWVNEARGIWERKAHDPNITVELARAVPDAIGWQRITEADIPKDRTFRDALKLDGKTLKHDIAKAREKARQIVRHMRSDAMPMLDVRFSRALADGDKAAIKAVEAERQKWRDAPASPAIESAKTTDELKAVLGL